MPKLVNEDLDQDNKDTSSCPKSTNGHVNGFQDEAILFDPYCNPKSPVVVTGEKVENAMAKIKGGVVRTPCTRTRLSDSLEMDLYFKKEYMQFTGSFKDRGALTALLNLTEEERNRGVITTSAGNHAQALAYQGSKLGIPVTVVMPVQAPLVKVNSCKNLNATVILHGAHFDEARRYAMSYGKKKNLLYINGYDHPCILAGQGTVGFEILEDIPDVEYIIVPIGGGGLIAGVAAYLKKQKPEIKIISVESERCPSWHTAVANGHPVACKKSLNGAKDSIADGLAVIEVGHNSFATANSLLDDVITISENFIALAILRLLEHEKSVVEGAGAAGFAAILSGGIKELQGKKVACILCGGNIDVNIVNRVIDRALMMDGRLCRFSCTISDRCGGLAKLLEIIAQVGANVQTIHHDRMTLPSYVYKTEVSCTVEIRNTKHCEELRTALFQEYGSSLRWSSG